MRLLYPQFLSKLKISSYGRVLKLLIFALSLQISTAYAQSITIRGKVRDSKNVPLPGATVKVKGTTTATVTSVNGDYTIKVPDTKAILVFSFISFQTQEQLVGSKLQIDVLLEEATNTLNDVVVVGYGEMKKKLLSTAVSSVGAKQIEDRLVATPGEALAGQISGVQVSQSMGDPGSAPVITVRGLGSIGAGNSPLFVVDGYPLNSADDFNNINPADIETVQVLKDAAAAAIYGSRGGNGIIIVTTKRGKSGSTKFNLSTNIGVANVSKKVDVLNKDQYVDYVKDAFANSAKTLPAIYNDPSSLVNTDWQNEIFQRGLTSSYALSASGGNDKVTFNTTGSYFKQTGLIKATDFDRYTLRASMDAQLTKKLKLSFNIAPSYAINDQTATGGGLNNALINGIGVNPSGVGGTVISALLQPPILPVRQPNGDYSNATVVLSGGGQTFSGNPYNPVAVLDLYKDRTTTSRVLSNTALEYDIIKGLKFRTNFGFEGIFNNRSWFVPSTLQSDNGPTANINNPLLTNIRARTTQGTNYNYVSENTLNYNTKIGRNHSLSLLAGYSFQKNTYTETSQAGQNGTVTNSIIENPNDAGVILGTYSRSDNALISGFGRANYSYKDKYLLSASIRTDGSSRFGLNKQYATFPAFSAAWRVAEEGFMKNITAISELKVRGSYGVSGNNNIGNYSSQSYATQVNYVFGAGNASPVFGFSPSTLANADLTWETNKQTDIGLEIGLLGDRIYFTADAYHRLTTNLLLSRGVPGIYGYANTIFTNVGSVENNGLEFSIKTANLTGKLKWTTDANISFNQNKVISLTDDGNFVGYDAAFGYTNSIRVVPGEAMSSFYGYRQIGVYRDAADVAASPKWAAGGSVPGDVKYEDVNGDGKIDASDIVNIGSPLPKFNYGFTNRFDYKNFNLSFLFQGTYGNKVLNSADRYTDYYNGSFNVRTNALNRWRSATDQGDGFTPRAAVTNPSSTTVVSTRNIFDGSYLRLRNVTLGYSLAGNVLRKLRINSARMFLTAENLATFTKYFGYNPEVNVWAGSSAPRYGVDQGTYPLPRTFSVGLNVGF
ncbi:TonB-linked SusC/RagA family outer membrane protein [Mucilaginibacter gracilis]|uniref:TonB-linked SusC/RagA family outer membrane protein n=1 Tax=Mucilaginibacter gracilis TaxID=423350 RepID=A0A495J3X3_9SPHI|nr:TonB-dependent receptor [Mucilaginibacter gracilis]RKR83685.1 TonB-linked SusC/RagA family outer membrane protein [Mucilaginibacter gracilis]